MRGYDRKISDRGGIGRGVSIELIEGLVRITIGCCKLWLVSFKHLKCVSVNVWGIVPI